MTTPPLWPTQRAILTTIANDPDASLTTIATRLGRPRPAIASLLSRAYQQLGVAHEHPTQRRAAAIAVARQHGLIPAQQQAGVGQ